MCSDVNTKNILKARNSCNIFKWTMSWFLHLIQTVPLVKVENYEDSKDLTTVSWKNLGLNIFRKNQSSLNFGLNSTPIILLVCLHILRYERKNGHSYATFRLTLRLSCIKSSLRRTASCLKCTMAHFFLIYSQRSNTQWHSTLTMIENMMRLIHNILSMAQIVCI